MKTNQKANHQLKRYNLFLLSLFRVSVHVHAHVHARVCTCVRMSIICDIATFPLHQSTFCPLGSNFQNFGVLSILVLRLQGHEDYKENPSRKWPAD